MFGLKKLASLLSDIQADLKQLEKNMQQVKEDISTLSKNCPTLLEKWQKVSVTRDVWDFKSAQECLDIIIINASLNQPQTLKFKDYEVEVVKKQKTKKVNRKLKLVEVDNCNIELEKKLV